MLTNRNVGRHHQAMTRSTSGAAQAAARSHSTLENWLRAQGSANTRAAYRSDFTMFGSWCSHQGAIPLAADTATLAAFQAARIAAGDSPLTIRRRMSALSSFYCFAVEQHVVAVNPALGVSEMKWASPARDARHRAQHKQLSPTAHPPPPSPGTHARDRTVRAARSSHGCRSAPRESVCPLHGRVAPGRWQPRKPAIRRR